MNSLLAREMDRKEFLITLGIIFLAVTGISSVLKNIQNISLSQTTSHSSVGFGAGSYGGVRKGNK